MKEQRNTVQRQIVLDALIKLKTHPAIDELHARIQNEHPAISKTTVYRNLRQLAKNGLIRQVSLPDGLERYDGRNDKHYHFMCKNCGAIFDVDLDYVVDLDDKVRGKYAFKVDEHDVVFSGVCQTCAASPG